MKYCIIKNNENLKEYLDDNSISINMFLLKCCIILRHKETGISNSSIQEKNGSITLFEIDSNETFCNCLKLTACDENKCNTNDSFGTYAFYENEEQYQRDKEDLSDFTIIIKKKGDVLLISDTESNQTDIKAKRINKIIENVLSSKNLLIKDLSILSSDELQLIKQFNQGGKLELPEKNFIELFKLSVNANKNKLAVSCLEDKITFKELDEKSDRLAKYIVDNYNSDENFIGIFLNRSIDYIVSILGIMKSGNAYIPIDSDTLNPGYDKFPLERLKYMVKETEMSLIVTDQKLTEVLSDINCDKLELTESFFKNQSADGLDVQISMNHAAYGIFTSGSTGHPKLTIIEHHSLINLFCNLDESIFKNMKLPSDVNISINAPFGFDASLQQIVGILKGYHLNIMPEDLRRSIRGVIKFINEKSIDIYDCTPSQMKLLINEGFLDECKELQVVLVGAEEIDLDMWNTLANQDTMSVYNMYGPTECTVDTTYCLINNYNSSKYSSIGRPFKNSNIYILDDNKKPVPIGVVGEIYISGEGVARGYYKQEKENAYHFINNLELFGTSSRIYRTGDFGTFMYNGDIVFKGRNDDQIKIRSHRIELNEITTIIKVHPNVKDAYVMIHDNNGYKELVAYIILDDNVELTQIEEKLFEILRTHLCTYMIPNHFIQINEFPLNYNNKIDKKKLSKLISEIKAPLSEGNREMSEDEKKIEEIMKKILKVNAIGVKDNFMKLGGESLRVMMLLSEIYKTFLCEIDYLEFFENSTIEKLALLIDEKRSVILH